MPTIKIFFGGDVRRVTTKRGIHWDEVVKLLGSLFGDRFHPELRIQYVDNEGDDVTITSEIEWQEAVLQHPDGLVRLKIIESDLPCFKDATEAPKPLYFYTENPEEPVQVGENLGDDIISIVSSYFKDRKILPYNIPEWLKPAVSVKPSARDDADIDVDCEKLFYVLFERGLQLLREERVEEGRKTFEHALCLKPRHEITLYNIACALALENKPEDALKYLRQCIDCGYHNFAHMSQDPDLEAVRELPEYSELLEQASLVQKEAEVECEESDKEDESEASQTTDEWVEIPRQNEEEEPEEQQEQLPEEDKEHGSDDDHEEVGEAAPAPEPLAFPFQEQLEQIKRMGFELEDTLVCEALVRFVGDVSAVVEWLLTR